MQNKYDKNNIWTVLCMIGMTFESFRNFRNIYANFTHWKNVEYFEKTQTLCLIFGGIIFGSGLKDKFNSSAGWWVGKLQKVLCLELVITWQLSWPSCIYDIYMYIGVYDMIYMLYISVNMAYMTFYIWTYGIYGNCIWDGKCHIIMIFTYFALRASCLSLGHTLMMIIMFFSSERSSLI